MSPVQTEYTERMRLPSAGTVKGSDYGSKTGVVETAAGIAFGVAVSQGSNDQGVILGGATLANFRGVTIRDITGKRLSTDTADKYAQYQSLGYLNRGEIWVEPTVAVGPTDPVHYDSATGKFAVSGGVGPIIGAKWRTSAEANEPALLELMAVGA